MIFDGLFDAAEMHLIHQQDMASLRNMLYAIWTGSEKKMSSD